MIISFKKDVTEVSSKKKWFIVGIIIALLNPIFSGLVIAFSFLTEPKFRKEGKIILIISFIWAIALAYIIDWMKRGGYL
jgi:uncharacterized membrane protein YdbT with pleckstrin-like domain